MSGHWLVELTEKGLIADLTEKLAASQARESKLRDFAQWLTGCCDLTQYDYFLQNRHILAEQPDDTALKEYRKKVLLEAADVLEEKVYSTEDGHLHSEYHAADELRKMAEE